MSETTGQVRQCSISNTITLTDTYVNLFTVPIYDSVCQISMFDTDTEINVGSVFIIVSGGVAKNICFTGGVGFSGSTDLVALPFSYNVTLSTTNYTVWFEYTDNKIQVSCNTQDPTTTITFTGCFTTHSDQFPNNVTAVDSLVENNAGAGISFGSKVIMNNGVVNIGSNSGSSYDVNIGTNSSAGGRTVNIGNTISGSAIVLAGQIETPNPSQDTITLNDSSSISWTDVSSTAQRIGKLCHVVVKANMAADDTLTKGESYNFFTITPSNKYNTNFVVTGSAVDTETNDVGAIYSVANTSSFKIIIPHSIATNNSTTIIASATYIST